MKAVAILRMLVPLFLLAGIAACGKQEEAPPPLPQKITGNSIAQFCHMAVVEHAGPKGQIFVKGHADPFWFASVRDTFAFTMLPEEPKDITAIYVTDMAKERDWNNPAPTSWVEARKAVFVIESRKRSGMAEAEAVPFSETDAANLFVAENGGRIVRFDEMPRAYILPSGDVAPAAPMNMDTGAPEGKAQPHDAGSPPAQPSQPMHHDQ